MNLQSISDRYMVTAIDAADAPDYALGAPKRVTEKPAAEPERWIATGTPGYVKSTTTGAIRTNDGPMPVYSPKAPPRGPLIAPDEDDGACCVPSVEDVLNAVVSSRGSVAACDKAIELASCGAWNGFWESIPADKRAAVIKALNALGA